MEEVKIFLFTRWIATCYADEHLDNEMKCDHDEGFKSIDFTNYLQKLDGILMMTIF